MLRIDYHTMMEKTDPMNRQKTAIGNVMMVFLCFFMLSSCVKNLQQTRFFKLLEEQSPEAYSALKAQQADVEAAIYQEIEKKLAQSPDYQGKSITKVTYWFESKGSFDYRIVADNKRGARKETKPRNEAPEARYISSAGIIRLDLLELDYSVVLRFHDGAFKVETLTVRK